MDSSIITAVVAENYSVALPSNAAVSQSPIPTKTFPTDVLKWMKANAKPQMSLKLMQVSKYFQLKEFPYFVIKDIIISNDRIPLLPTYYDYYTLDGCSHCWVKIEDTPNNLWITDSISVDLLPQTYFLSQLIPKIVVCEVKKLYLVNQKISFADFKILTSSGTVKELRCERTIVCDENGVNVPFENYLKYLPAIEHLYFVSSIPSFSSCDAAKQRVLPNLKTVKIHFTRRQRFDVKAFIKFMSKHRTVQFALIYPPSSHCPHAKLLQRFVDKIIQVGGSKYPPPRISFPGQTRESVLALRAFRNEYSQK